MTIPQELLTALPDDFCDVHVEDEMDARRLLWLIQQVGEEKVRKSARKYRYYPDSKIFVSVILKWYNRKVPTHVYAPVYKPIYSVYLAPSAIKPAFKVGFTGQPVTHRLYSFTTPDIPLTDVFKIDQSLYVLAGTKRAAMSLERQIKKSCTARTVTMAYLAGLTYGACCHTEWFYLDALPTALAIVAELGFTTRPIAETLEWPDLHDINTNTTKN